MYRPELGPTTRIMLTQICSRARRIGDFGPSLFSHRGSTVEVTVRRCAVADGVPSREKAAMEFAAVANHMVSRYIDWGVLHVSVGNLVVVLIMLAVFVLALVLPFPGEHEERPGGGSR